MGTNTQTFPNTNNYILNQSGELNPVICATYFQDKSFTIPQQVLNASNNSFTRLYALQPNPNAVFSYIIDSTGHIYIGTQEILQDNYNNINIIIEFLQKIQHQTTNEIINIDIVYSKTTSNSFRTFPWHNDKRKGRNVRQMSILLQGDVSTEFAVTKNRRYMDMNIYDEYKVIGKKDINNSSESVPLILKCLPNQATYWKNPLNHRKPSQKDNETRIILIVQFEFITLKGLDLLEENLKNIQNNKPSLLDMNAWNEYIKKMKLKSLEIESDSNILNILNPPKLGKLISPTYYGGEFPDCFRTNAPECNLLMGGKKTYNYNNRTYKIRYGKRGGKFILVDDKKIYIK